MFKLLLAFPYYFSLHTLPIWLTVPYVHFIFYLGTTGNKILFFLLFSWKSSSPFETSNANIGNRLAVYPSVSHWSAWNKRHMGRCQGSWFGSDWRTQLRKDLNHLQWPGRWLQRRCTLLLKCNAKGEKSVHTKFRNKNSYSK